MHWFDGAERGRLGGPGSRGRVEGLASSVDLSVGIELRTWLTRVAINEALQSYRRERNKPLCQALGDFDALDSHAESPSSGWAQRYPKRLGSI